MTINNHISTSSWFHTACPRTDLKIRNLVPKWFQSNRTLDPYSVVDSLSEKEGKKIHQTKWIRKYIFIGKKSSTYRVYKLFGYHWSEGLSFRIRVWFISLFSFRTVERIVRQSVKWARYQIFCTYFLFLFYWFFYLNKYSYAFSISDVFIGRVHEFRDILSNFVKLLLWIF